MKKTETRVLEMMYKVRQFILARSAAFPVGSRGHELYEALGTHIGNMETHSAAQSMRSHALKEKTVQKKVAYAALRKALGAIFRTARSMARTVTGIEEKFRLPSNRDVQTWLATARAFLNEAEPHVDEFVRRGMASDFIDDLKARILAVEQSVDSKAEHSTERAASTAGVAEASGAGLKVVEELEPIIQNIYNGNDAEIAAWQTASHVTRTPRHAAVAAPAATAATA